MMCCLKLVWKSPVIIRVGGWSAVTYVLKIVIGSHQCWF